MKFVRFAHKGVIRWGVPEGDAIRFVAGDVFAGEYTRVDETVSAGAVRLLAPCQPEKIVCVGLNYRRHAEELGMPVPEEPLLFLKPPSAIVAAGEAIVLPEMSRQVEFEAELGIVIGRQCRNVRESEALGCVCGYTCVNDVTARDLQRRDVQFTRSKSFDTFAPIGPCLETGIDPDDTVVRSSCTGRQCQCCSTRDFIFPVPRLIAFISRVMTLKPGDVIATGTPAGVGGLAPGDTIEVTVQGVGTLANPVQAQNR